MAGRGGGRGGRGGGRGRGSLSFNVELLGFGRGEALPTATLQPPPLFPPLEYKPAPLSSGEPYDYWAALKQELRANFNESSFYVQPVSRKKDVERYSDKYNTQATSDDVEWALHTFPRELHPAKKKVAKKQKGSRAKGANLKGEDIEKKLQELEAAETATMASDEEVAEEKSEEEENVEEEELDEEELEEETDYALSYFDNGEEYGDAEDDNLDEGPVY